MSAPARQFYIWRHDAGGRYSAQISEPRRR
jgi:hypothetical protein